MKRSVLFLIVIFLLASASSLQQVNAQDKTKEEQEKEIMIQKTIDEQKKSMADQKRAQEDALQQLQHAQEALDSINVEVEVDASDIADKAVRAHVKRIDRSFRFEEPDVFTGINEPFYFHSFGGDNESTSWEFSRRVKEKTLKSEYTFDVEKTANSVVMAVMGDCKAGEIRIKIVMPSGKTYSDVVIDEFGNLNWRKSFSISETENQDKAGAWKFVISSNKATGYFKISLQAY
ncbi:MAG: hypothetical protein IPJ37_15695 [Bacteroidales bacterium]|nr:hypothetical protein [Bacteroidales bacterium]